MLSLCVMHAHLITDMLEVGGSRKASDAARTDEGHHSSRNRMIEEHFRNSGLQSATRGDSLPSSSNKSYNQFLTGHEIFDEIMDIAYGSTILLVDDTFSEGRDLLSALLANLEDVPIYEVARKPLLHCFGTLLLEESLSPTDASIRVNSTRRKGRAVLIHSYLPDFLIKNGAEHFLKLLETWKTTIEDCNTLEFFLLPRGVFEEAERKIFSLLDGALDLRIMSSGNSYLHTLTPMRCSKPEYHMSKFQYTIKEKNLLIKWRGQLTDHVPVTTEEIRKTINFISENSSSLSVKKGLVEANLSLQDKLLFSQVPDNTVADSLALLFDRVDNLLMKLAEWYEEGFIEFVRSAVKESKPVKTRLSLKSRIALALPVWLSTRVITRGGLMSHRVPAQAYLIRRKSDEAFYSVFLRQNPRQTQITLEGIEEFLQDIATRRVTQDVIKSLGEDPRNVLDRKYVRKIISIMLSSGYSVDPKIKAVNEDTYQIQLSDCPICFGSRSEKPICQSLSGAISGNAAFCFKRKAICEETKCIAAGDDKCTFLLRFQ